MRVLALGGSGGMGRHACRTAVTFDAVDELIVADLDFDQAAAVAAQLGPTARPLAVDVTAASSLASALDGADIVLNTVGPFFRFGVPVLSAAIDAGCHYLDICDDWEPTQDMLALHDRAVAADRVALIGIGASPGLANLLAVLAARELDVVREIVTGWNIDAAQPEASVPGRPSAALIHGVRQMTGTIRLLRGGALHDERPLRKTSVDYPGLGRRTARTFGHPEPITLHAYDDRLESSVNVVHGARATLAAARGLAWAVDHRLLRTERAIAAVSWFEDHAPAPKPEALFRAHRLPPLFAVAAGRHAERPGSVGAALSRTPGMTMGALTGVPLAVALKMLLDGKVAGPGVRAPECALDPAEFFAELATHCPGTPRAADMVLVTRSWDPGARAAYRAGAETAGRHLAAHSG